MLVTAISNSGSDLPVKYQRYAFGQDDEGRLPFTIGKKYVVSAIKTVTGDDFYLVISDDNELSGHPWWYPASLFTVLDNTKPDDWTESSEVEPLKMTGFSELVNDRDGNFYDALEDGEKTACDIFMKHYEQYAKAHDLWYVDGKTSIE